MIGFLGQIGYILIGILLLGILVAVHEFGHFMAARLTGIEVMEFAIGMGPKLIGWTGKKGTKFSLRCIPFGGITRLVEGALEKLGPMPANDLADIFHADQEARRVVKELLPGIHK